MNEKTCPYCNLKFRSSRFHPDQEVCSSSECQRRRSTEYHRRKLAEDPAYREQCKESQALWRGQNPGYMKRYRERRKSGKGTSAPAPATLAELQRLLNLVKNNLAKNNSALAVTRCAAEVFLIRRSDAAGVKNSLAGSKVIVLQADPSG